MLPLKLKDLAEAAGIRPFQGMFEVKQVDYRCNLLCRFFLHHRLPVVTWLAISVAGLGIIWMFLHEGGNAFSLVGSLVLGALIVNELARTFRYHKVKEVYEK